jgi:hypothetical protein
VRLLDRNGQHEGLSDLLDAVDRSDTVLVVLRDLPAGFDTLDHDILLDHRHTSFGIQDAALY